jgi:hypothetical protein
MNITTHRDLKVYSGAFNADDVKPRWGSRVFTGRYPACAARHWALEFNRVAVLLLVSAFWLLNVIGVHATSLDSSVPKFVTRYCMDCHDAATEKGDRNFESFLKTPVAIDQHQTLEEILEQLNLGEMPPKKKSVEQPSDAERRKMVAEITRYLTTIESSAKPASTVMRRLTRYEYNYTIRDLLGVDTAAADKTRLFPADTRTHGFANLGSAQALSDHQLRLYLEAAREYLDLTLVFGREKPEVRKWVFRPLDLNGEKKNSGSVRYRVWAKDGSHLDIAHGQPVDNGPTYPKQFVRQGVPVDGRYRVRVKATAIGRQHPYDPAIFPNDLTVPLQLGLWHVPDESFLGKRAAEGRILVGVYDLPDNTPREIEATVWMPTGSTPFVHWINGPGASKAPLRRLTERYHPEALRKSQTKVDRLREQGVAVPKDALVQRVYISDVYQGPRVRVFEISLEGPLPEQWPPAGHRNVVGKETDPQSLNVARVLTAFASKAFRRPVPQREVVHHIEFVRQQMAAGVRKAEAIKQGLTAILTSPRFLFLDEGDPSKSGSLDDHQLASRLSYALWSSMPDDRLLQLAAADRLSDTKNLAAEIDRLIDDQRSSAFVHHFTDAWLHLYKIGSMPPGAKQFPAYFRGRLEPAMRTETRLFVADALKHNRPLKHLLNSSTTFVNGSLARHYGLTNVVGDEFRKVSFSADRRRAGLLGHASVLTATANGVETSPVVRGVWVLENILGTPPSPPPPDVPPIEPDTRGATTIRDQLAKHRNVAACADCHAKIDPWGFALEFYDPIGGFRTHYPHVGPSGRVAKLEGKRIDGSGELPGGEFIHNDGGLRTELLKRKDQFARNLVKKFLTHATGRELTFRDNAEVEQITDKIARSGYGFRDLVRMSLQSQIFRSR